MLESKDIILSVDSIVEVRLCEGQNAQFIIADNADMDVSEITSTLNCKFVQFIIAQQLALTSSSTGARHEVFSIFYIYHLYTIKYTREESKLEKIATSRFRSPRINSSRTLNPAL